MLLYQHGFNDFQMGYASAMAIILLAVSFAVTMVIVLNSRKWVHTGGARDEPPRPCLEPSLRRPAPRRRPSAAGASCSQSRITAVLIAAAIAFLAPFVFITLTALMTNNQTLSADLWPHPFRWPNFSTSSRRRRSCAGR